MSSTLNTQAAHNLQIEIFKRIPFLVFLFPVTARADFQSSIQSLVTAVTTGLFPAIVMYEAGLAGIAFAKKRPDAKDKAEATALGAVMVLGLNGVWSYFKAHIQ